MRMMKAIAALVLTSLLGACGGGGDVPLDSGGGGGTGTPTDTTVNVGIDVTNLAGQSVNRITSSETARVVATVTSTTGGPQEGIVVTFGESAASLLKFAPTSRTALTDASGQAAIEVSASDASSAGATIVTAQAVGVTTASSQTKAIEISSTGGSPTAPIPKAINFVQVVPASSSIVIKGAGGAGRSESATLTFKVVDSSNAPIKGAIVNFSVNPSEDVTLNIASAESNSDGLVTTTVSSGIKPTAVVVTATSDAAPAVKTQSDTLVVSNGVVLPAGFELVASKYNLDGTLTGDSTNITAFVRDEFGNPVPQGVAVSFVTDYGAVGTATSGGCTTNNQGRCTVPFSVQDPRGNGLATVLGTIKKGDGTEIVKALFINMSGSTGRYTGVLASSGQIPTTVATSNSTCKVIFDMALIDGAGRAPAAGTTITVKAPTGLTVTIVDGNPVLDIRDIPVFSPAPFTVEVNSGGLGCKTDTPNTKAGSSFFTLKYTTPGALTVFTQRILVTYRTP